MTRAQTTTWFVASSRNRAGIASTLGRTGRERLDCHWSWSKSMLCVAGHSLTINNVGLCAWTKADDLPSC